jgi:hypothetical protein
MNKLVIELNRLTDSTATPRRLSLAIDLIVLVWIGLFAWQHAGFFLRNDVYLFGDHPGQFYRLWHLAEVIWPEDGSLVGSSPYWFAGLYNVAGYEPTWVEAKQAGTTVLRYERNALDIQIDDAAPDTNLSVKVSYYPLWRAEANGQPVPIQMDRYGLMTLSLSPGSYTLHLRYQPGRPEQIGGLISMVTIIGAIGGVVFYYLRLIPKQIRNVRRDERTVPPH